MNKFLPILALCALFTSYGLNAAPSDQTNAPATPKEEQSPDWQLTVKVKEAILANGELSPSNRFVSVTTTDGVVTLTGNVSTVDQINEIVKTAEGVSGVKKVINQMVVSTS